MTPDLWPGLMQSGDRVLAMVSGGADSLCLLHLLAAGRPDLGIDVAAFHLHHGMRGEAADADVEFLRGICENLRLPLEVARVDVPAMAEERGVGLEEAGRRARYEAAGDAARQRHCNRIATGHTADDQAETVLMRILRGTGIDGLAGIPPSRLLNEDDPDGPTVIRPILGWRRADVEAYCREHGLRFLHDVTNEDPAFLRNRVRRDLLPRLEREYNPQIRGRLVSLAEQAAHASEWLRADAEHVLADVWLAEGRLSLAGLAELPPSLRSRALALAVRRLAPNVELDHATLRRLAQLASDPEARSFTVGATGLRAAREEGVLSLGPLPAAPPGPPEPIPFQEERVEWPHPRCVIHRQRVRPPEDPHGPPEVALLDAGEIQGSLVVRAARPGERFQPLGAPGHMKLSDFFINRKLPRYWRRSWPLVCDQEKVLWVVGMAIGEEARVTTATRECVQLTTDLTQPPQPGAAMAQRTEP